ncbi:MAG: glycoside hydrolase [Planctomycetota bacterium]|nr:glycoside hydrolase [Planctomycetota bacterium]
MPAAVARDEIEGVYVPWLHMHQPDVWWDFGSGERLMGNLERMLASGPGTHEREQAERFCRAYANPAVYAKRSRSEGVCSSLTLDFSGTLLRSLAELSAGGAFASIEAGGETVGDVLRLYRDAIASCEDRLEIAGSTFCHCYLPSVPDRDMAGQVEAWREQFAAMFGQRALSRVRGFWPPEMGIFGDEERLAGLIRTLKRYGYQWMIIPRSAVCDLPGSSTARIENQPHWIEARDGLRRERMTVVIADTEMSLRQEKGLSGREAAHGLKYRSRMLASDGVPAPALMIGVSDGENGAFVRGGFFEETFLAFGHEAMFDSGITSMTVSDYLAAYFPNGPATTVTVRREGGSRIGGHACWTEGEHRRRIIREIYEVSARLEAVEKRLLAKRKRVTSLMGELKRARFAVWNCGTSCYVAWGNEFWFGQAWRSLRHARECVGKLESATRE